MEKLKPCPFCGGEAIIKPAGFYMHVECSKCQSRGKPFNTDTSDFTHNAKEEAIRAWNKRVAAAENAQLRTELDTANNKITVLLCSVIALQAELEKIKTSRCNNCENIEIKKAFNRYQDFTHHFLRYLQKIGAVKGTSDTIEDLQNKLDAELDEYARPCKWKYDELNDMWETECGEAFCVTEGDLKNNGLKFCPYCGHKIKEESGCYNCKSGGDCECPEYESGGPCSGYIKKDN